MKIDTLTPWEEKYFYFLKRDLRSKIDIFNPQMREKSFIFYRSRRKKNYFLSFNQNMLPNSFFFFIRYRGVEPFSEFSPI